MSSHSVGEHGLSKAGSLRSQASASSLASGGHGTPHKIFSPDDFKRTRSSLTSQPLRSRNGRAPGSPDTTNLTDFSDSGSAPINFTSSHDSAPSNHDTFGHSMSPTKSPRLRATIVPSYYNESREELVSLEGESVEDDQDSASPSSLEATLLATPTASRRESESSCILKEEAAQEWARYDLRRTMLKSPTPKLVADTFFNNPPSVGAGSSSPVPRSSIVLSALPKDGNIRRSASLASYLDCNTTPPSLDESCSSSIFTEIKQSGLSDGVHGFVGRPESGLGIQYPASIVSATTASMSPLSVHLSLDSGVVPLLRTTSLRDEDKLVATNSVERASRTNDLPRPVTTNQLTPEERRHQVRRTKKLVQVLGEEMLYMESNKPFAPNQASGASKSASYSRDTEAFKQGFVRTSTGENTTKEFESLTRLRPSSAVSHSSSLNSMSSSVSIDPMSNSRSGRWRIRRDKRESLDEALPFRMNGAALDSLPTSSSSGQVSTTLSPKAASILGISLNHVRSTKVHSTAESGHEGLAGRVRRAEQNDNSGPSPSRHTEQDTSSHPNALERARPRKNASQYSFHGSPQVSSATTVPAGSKQSREERRRKVAKMTRWLGEAVPVELVAPELMWSSSHNKPLDMTIDPADNGAAVSRSKMHEVASSTERSELPKTSSKGSDVFRGVDELNSFHPRWDDSSFSAPESAGERRSAKFERLQRQPRASMQSRGSSNRPGTGPADSDKSSSFFDPSTPALKAWQRKRSCSLQSIDTSVYSKLAAIARERAVQEGVSFMSIDSSDSEDDESPCPPAGPSLSAGPGKNGESRQAISSTASFIGDSDESEGCKLKKRLDSSTDVAYHDAEGHSSDLMAPSSTEDLGRSSSSSNRKDAAIQPPRPFLYLDSDSEEDEDDDDDADDEESDQAGELDVVLDCFSDLSFDLDGGKVQPSVAKLEESRRRNRKLTRFFGLPPPPPALPAPLLRKLPPIPPTLPRRNASLPARHIASSSLGSQTLKSLEDEVMETEHCVERSTKHRSGRMDRLKKKGSRILA